MAAQEPLPLTLLQVMGLGPALRALPGYGVLFFSAAKVRCHRRGTHAAAGEAPTLPDESTLIMVGIRALSLCRWALHLHTLHPDALHPQTLHPDALQYPQTLHPDALHPQTLHPDALLYPQNLHPDALHPQTLHPDALQYPQTLHPDPTLLLPLPVIPTKPKPRPHLAAASACSTRHPDATLLLPLPAAYPCHAQDTGGLAAGPIWGGCSPGRDRL